MKTNNARKVSEQAFNEILEAVEAGRSQKLVEYLKAMGKFHNYSLGNAILINFQCPKATRVAGYRTWQKLGRYVRRNEKGIAIMAPIVRRRNVMDTNDEIQKRVTRLFDLTHEDDNNRTVIKNFRGACECAIEQAREKEERFGELTLDINAVRLPDEKGFSRDATNFL